jgi:hypothetical protein
MLETFAGSYMGVFKWVRLVQNTDICICHPNPRTIFRPQV